MEKFEKVLSSAVPLPIENIDTDQIIPARFLKATTRDGFGDNLFRDWRYVGGEKTDFVLNNPIYQGNILVAGKNFGCGSSREHAAWALIDYGFHVVVSSHFADIFQGNALNNGLLPIAVSEDFLHKVFMAIERNPHEKFEVDLEAQTFEITSEGLSYTFEIDPFKKSCLLKGYEDIDYLLSIREKIVNFEKQQVIY